MAQWLDSGLSDPLSNSPFVHTVTIYIALNHKESIPNFNDVTSLHPSRVRTLLITSTSQMGANTLSSSGDAANWHWQQVALKGRAENCGAEEKAQILVETPAKWAEGRGGRWGVDSWKLLPVQLPALNFSQYPHH